MTRTATLFTVLFLIAFATPSAVLAQGTPTGPDYPAVEWRDMWETGEVTREENSTSIVWGEPSAFDDAIGFIPVSLLFTYYEDDNLTMASVFVELQNVTDSSLHAPDVVIGLYQDDHSFGAESLLRKKPWVEAGGSAFYEQNAVYGNSVTNTAWNDVDVTAGGQPELINTDGIRWDRNNLYNDRTETLPPVQLGVAVLDKSGLFVGTCNGPSTGAFAPPGGSLRLDDPVVPDRIDWACKFTLPVGQYASEELGVGGPFQVEYFVADIAG